MTMTEEEAAYQAAIRKHLAEIRTLREQLARTRPLLSAAKQLLDAAGNNPTVREAFGTEFIKLQASVLLAEMEPA